MPRRELMARCGMSPLSAKTDSTRPLARDGIGRDIAGLAPQRVMPLLNGALKLGELKKQLLTACLLVAL